MVPQNATTASIDFASPEPASTISSLCRTATNRGAARTAPPPPPAPLLRRNTPSRGYCTQGKPAHFRPLTSQSPSGKSQLCERSPHKELRRPRKSGRICVTPRPPVRAILAQQVLERLKSYTLQAKTPGGSCELLSLAQEQRLGGVNGSRREGFILGRGRG